MYIDIGTCICKSISIYVSRDAYIGRGLQGIKASKLNPEPSLVGTVGRCRRDALGRSVNQAVTVLGFSRPDVKCEDRPVPWQSAGESPWPRRTDSEDSRWVRAASKYSRCFGSYLDAERPCVVLE